MNRANYATRWAVALAAMIFAGSLAGCGITVTVPPAATQETNMQTTEFSSLDEAGIAEINASGSLRLDFRNGTISKSDVGLAPDSYAPDLKAADGGSFGLEITGPNGVLTATTDRVRFTTTDTSPDIHVIYYFLTAATLEDYAQLLRDGVRDYGLDSDVTERWITDAEADPGMESSFSLGDGNTLGFNVNYDLRYDGSKETQVVIVSVS